MSFKDNTLFTNPRLDDYSKRYKEYIEDLTKKQQGDKLFKYFHFEYSPSGIKVFDLGRCSRALLLNEPLWISKPGWNSPAGWKIQIAMDTANEKISPCSIKNGLECKIVDLSTEKIESAKALNSGIFSNNIRTIMNKMETEKKFIKSKSSSFDNFDNAINRVSITKLANRNMGIEWTGYFKPKSLGIYDITFNCGDGYCYVWLDNKAVCEYLPINSNISASGGKFQFDVKEDKYYPIRIQFYLSRNSVDPVNTELIISNNETGKKLDTKTCLYTLDGGKYLPRLKFFAFVSESLESFYPGKFKCFYFNGKTNEDYAKFYNLINKYKYDFADKKYDREKSSGVLEYGTLPDGTNYTAVDKNGSILPKCYSIYRFEADIRMGKIFQIDQRGINGKAPYPMKLISKNLVMPGQSYQELSNFYPELKDIQNSIDLSPEKCKQKCSSETGCSYYYTYLPNTSTKNKCYTGKKNEKPSFSQIRPENIKENTSTLSLRDYRFPKVNCGIQPTLGEFENVENTTFYGDSFPYSRYKLMPNLIQSRKNLGICGDERFVKFDDEAKRILYKNANYIDSGKKWKEGFSVKEGFDKNTTGVSDTLDSIKSSLSNEQIYGSTQVSIDKNYYDLSKNLIPNYLHVKDIMNNNVNYDFSGNVLLNFRNKPIPTLREQTVIDTNDTLFMQNNLYILGILTMLCLLTLAIIAARA
jgi:hypothetical protein